MELRRSGGFYGVDQLGLMRKANCHGLAFGVEAGTQKILDRLKKRQTLAQVERAVTEAKRQGIPRVHGFFVVGSPDETASDILDSFRFAARLHLDTFGFNRLCVYRGTPLWQEYVQRGKRDFLPVYQRKQLEAAERKEKKALRRQKAKARKAAVRAEAQLRKEAIRETLRSMDRCCGVFRKLTRGRATCPKCGSRVAMPKLQRASISVGEDAAVPAINCAVSGSSEPPDCSDASSSVLPAPGGNGEGVRNTPSQP